MVVRQPLLALVAPPLVLVFGLFVDLALRGGSVSGRGWEGYWLQPSVLIAVPLLVVVWVLLAWRERPAGKPGAGLGRFASATLVGVLLAGAYLLATAQTVFVGALVGSVLLTAVPIAACEAGGPIRALRMSVGISRGSWTRILGAWLLLQAMLLFLTVLGVLAYELAAGVDSLVRGHSRLEVLVDVGVRLATPLRWTLTMALSIAAYRRLRRSQVTIDIDGWVEVFR